MLKTKIPENVKNFVVLSANNIIAQILGFIFLILITRLYSPNEFSQLVMLSNLLLWIGPVMCLKFDSAIIVADSKAEASNLFIGCVFISIIVSLIFSLIVILNNTTNVVYIEELNIYIWSLLVPVGIFFVGLSSAVKSILHYHKQYYFFSLTPIIFVTTNGVFAIAAYYIYPFGVSLLFSHTLGMIVSSTFLLSKVYSFGYLDNSVKILLIISSLKKNIKFPIHTAPSSLVDGLSQSMPIYFIYAIFSDVAVASFGLVIKIAIVPMRFIFGSVSTLLMKMIHDSVGTRYSVILFWKVSLYLLLFVVTVGLFIYLSSEAIVSRVFGDEWVYAGQILKIMGISMIYSAAISSLSSVLVATRRLKLGAFWQYSYFLSSTLFFLTFNEFGDANMHLFFVLLAVKEILFYTIYFVLISYSVHKPSLG